MVGKMNYTEQSFVNGRLERTTTSVCTWSDWDAPADRSRCPPWCYHGTDRGAGPARADHLL